MESIRSGNTSMKVKDAIMSAERSSRVSSSNRTQTSSYKSPSVMTASSSHYSTGSSIGPENVALFPILQSLEKWFHQFMKLCFEPTVSEASVDFFPLKVDTYARILTPIAFVVIQIFYWIIFLSMEKTI